MSSSTTYSSDHLARTLGTYLLVFGLVFGMSATVNIRTASKHMIDRGAWLIGLFIQFVLLPLIGWMVVKALNMNAASGTTLLILTTSPGGVYSNWFCSICNGDLAVSVTMSLVSMFVGIVMMPCNIILYVENTYGHEVVASMNWPNLFLSLMIVFGATLLGLCCNAQLNITDFKLFANRMGNICGLSLLLFTFLVMNFSDDLHINIWGQSWEFYIGVATPCVAGLAMSLVFSSCFKLSKQESIAVTYECCYQNVLLTTLLALTMFDKALLSDILAIPVYYALVQIVVLGSYSLFAWKMGWTKAPKDESICVVIGRSYEALEDDTREDQEDQEDHKSDQQAQRGYDIQMTETETVINESFDDGIISVNLQTVSTIDKKPNSDDVYVDDAVVDDEKIRKRRSLFKMQSQGSDVEAFTLSPTTTLCPEAFEHTTKDGKLFKRGRKSRASMASNAVQNFFMIEDTINEDSIAEDPDISIAGESDLESGLSMSHHADESSLSGFSLTKPSSRPSSHTGSRPSSRASRNGSYDPDQHHLEFPSTIIESRESMSSTSNSSIQKLQEEINAVTSEPTSEIEKNDYPSAITGSTEPVVLNENFIDEGIVEEAVAKNNDGDNNKLSTYNSALELNIETQKKEIDMIDDNDIGSPWVKHAEPNANIQNNEATELDDLSIDSSRSKDLRVRDDLELNTKTQEKEQFEKDDYSIGSRSKYSI